MSIRIMHLLVVFWVLFWVLCVFCRVNFGPTGAMMSCTVLSVIIGCHVPWIGLESDGIEIKNKNLTIDLIALGTPFLVFFMFYMRSSAHSVIQGFTVIVSHPYSLLLIPYLPSRRHGDGDSDGDDVVLRHTTYN